MPQPSLTDNHQLVLYNPDQPNLALELSIEDQKRPDAKRVGQDRKAVISKPKPSLGSSKANIDIEETDED